MAARVAIGAACDRTSVSPTAKRRDWSRVSGPASAVSPLEGGREQHTRGNKSEPPGLRPEGPRVVTAAVGRSRRAPSPRSVQ